MLNFCDNWGSNQALSLKEMLYQLATSRLDLLYAAAKIMGLINIQSFFINIFRFFVICLIVHKKSKTHHRDRCFIRIYRFWKIFGKKLAAELDYDFLDLDAFIEQEQLSISQLFEGNGINFEKLKPKRTEHLSYAYQFGIGFRGWNTMLWQHHGVFESTP